MADTTKNPATPVLATCGISSSLTPPPTTTGMGLSLASILIDQLCMLQWIMGVYASFLLALLIVWAVLGLICVPLQVLLSTRKSYLPGLVLPVFFACLAFFSLGAMLVGSRFRVGIFPISFRTIPGFILLVILLLVYALCRLKKAEHTNARVF